MKYNGDGSFGWHTAVKGYFDEEFNAIEATNDGYVAVGSSCSSNRDLKAVGNRGGSDALVVTFSNRATAAVVTTRSAAYACSPTVR